MKIIVGLGNPGEKYKKTRHNTGFMVLEQFLKDFEPVNKTVWEDSSKFKSDIANIEWKPKIGPVEKVILVKPKTYMNNSGMAVSLIAKFYKVGSEDIWIVHDELDLPLGSMKIRIGGSSAGQKGVGSIIDALGTDKFWRFRMGIGENRNHGEVGGHIIKHADEYVLSDFTGSDRSKAKELIKRGVKALECALEKGMESAMNQYNTK